MQPYLLVLAVAALITFSTTPLVLKLSRRIGAVDTPTDRKVHAVPTPSLGGIAIFLGFVGAMAVASVIEPFKQSFRPLFIYPARETIGILVAATIVFALGVVDDLTKGKGGVQAPVKLSVQLLAAGLAFLFGVRLEYLRVPGVGGLYVSQDVSAIVTVIWIVVVVNAVNLMDGLDGLAAGITSIASMAFFVYTYQLSQQGLTGPEPTAQVISIILVGATLGFLRYNFNPAKIFMGDSGSYTLGFLLAAGTVVGIGRTYPGESPSEDLLFYLPLVIPLIVLAVPIIDTLLAVVRRASKGQHIFHADREHIHHRLLEIGHGHRQAVIIMYGWAGVIAATMLALTFQQMYVLPFLGGALLMLVLYTTLPRKARVKT